MHKLNNSKNPSDASLRQDISAQSPKFSNQKRNSYIKFLFVTMCVFALDQILKYAFLQGACFDSRAITFGCHALVMNKGVAFSSLESIGLALKYLQILLLIVIFICIHKSKFLFLHPMSFGCIFGGGIGNIYDRFSHGGVIDYVYWHFGFNFAIFNFADVMIDVGIAIIVLQLLLKRQKI